MNIELVKLSREYKEQLDDMMSEWLSVEQNFSPYAIRKNDYRDFDFYLENLEVKEASDERVPDSTYFCLDKDRNIFVGVVNIRHYLNDNLCHTGGHIGDGIRPSERRKGYATAMIHLALEKCREMGMNKVLMTCGKDNIGSAKSIINNGGVFEREVEEDGETEQRYWITLHEEEIETERMILRREMPSDYLDAFSWSGDERVYKYLLSNPCKKPEYMLPWLERQDPNSRTRYVMIMRAKDDGHAVGTIGAFSDGGVWSIAYSIRHDDWGKGYAREAAKAVMDYLRETYDAHVFEAECAEENTQSERVMEKLGMHFDRFSNYKKHDGSAEFKSKIYKIEI